MELFATPLGALLNGKAHPCLGAWHLRCDASLLGADDLAAMAFGASEGAVDFGAWVMAATQF